MTVVGLGMTVVEVGMAEGVEVMMASKGKCVRSVCRQISLAAYWKSFSKRLRVCLIPSSIPIWSTCCNSASVL